MTWYDQLVDSLIDTWTRYQYLARIGQLPNGGPMPPELRHTLNSLAPAELRFLRTLRLYSRTDEPGMIELMKKALGSVARLRYFVTRTNVATAVDTLTTPITEQVYRLVPPDLRTAAGEAMRDSGAALRTASAYGQTAAIYSGLAIGAILVAAVAGAIIVLRIT